MSEPAQPEAKVTMSNRGITGIFRIGVGGLLCGILSVVWWIASHTVPAVLDSHTDALYVRQTDEKRDVDTIVREQKQTDDMITGKLDLHQRWMEKISSKQDDINSKLDQLLGRQGDNERGRAYANEPSSPQQDQP